MSGRMEDDIEKAFRNLTRILLGKELRRHPDYQDWLVRDVRMPTEHKSAVSDEIVYLPFLEFFQETEKKVVKLAEAEELGKRSISSEEIGTLDLESAPERLGELKLYAPEAIVGKNVDVRRSSRYGFSTHCYFGETFVRSKYCAYCMWPRDSEYIFGSDFVLSSKFCLKCFRSVNLARCFEVSHSTNCSDCYFCHNCEGLLECMFCFNTKGLRYAIGNREVGKEAYMRIKKLILGEIAEKLEKEKRLGCSIFNVGCLKS